MNRSITDLFRSLFGQPRTDFQAHGNTVEATYTPAPRPAPKPIFLGFTRWRTNPNWPGRRAAAARRTSGTTRRMR